MQGYYLNETVSLCYVNSIPKFFDHVNKSKRVFFIPDFCHVVLWPSALFSFEPTFYFLCVISSNILQVSFLWAYCSYAPGVSRIQFVGVCEFGDPCRRIFLFIRYQCAGIHKCIEDPCASFLRLSYLICDGLWRWSKVTRRMNSMGVWWRRRWVVGCEDEVARRVNPMSKVMSCLSWAGTNSNCSGWELFFLVVYFGIFFIFFCSFWEFVLNNIGNFSAIIVRLR